MSFPPHTTWIPPLEAYTCVEPGPQPAVSGCSTCLEWKAWETTTHFVSS